MLHAQPVAAEFGLYGSPETADPTEGAQEFFRIFGLQVDVKDLSHLPTNAGFTDYHLILQQRLSALEPDYELAIEEAHAWGQDWLELAVVCCAMHAQSIGQTREAARVASLITSSELYGRQATQILLSSIKSMMLKELVQEDEHDYYRHLFQAAL